MDKEIEKLVENKKRSSITDLNEVPQSLIEEARKLVSPISMEMYFTYLVIPSDHNYIRRFIVDCVEGNIAPETWLRGGTLVPSLDLEDLLTKRREVILSGINDSFTHYIEVNYNAWKYGSSFGGGPALVDLGFTYRTPLPEGMVFVSGKKTIPRSAVNNVAMHRRWIAQMIAGCMDIKETDSREQIVEKVSEIVPENKWIDDVHFAIKGLSAEAEQGLIKEGVVPGFILPDELYM